MIFFLIIPRLPYLVFENIYSIPCDTSKCVCMRKNFILTIFLMTTNEPTNQPNTNHYMELYITIECFII